MIQDSLKAKHTVWSRDKTVLAEMADVKVSCQCSWLYVSKNNKVLLQISLLELQATHPRDIQHDKSHNHNTLNAQRYTIATNLSIGSELKFCCLACILQHPQQVHLMILALNPQACRLTCYDPLYSIPGSADQYSIENAYLDPVRPGYILNDLSPFFFNKHI